MEVHELLSDKKGRDIDLFDLVGKSNTRGYLGKSGVICGASSRNARRTLQS